MITNPKTLVDMGANAAIMVAFTIPGSGPVIAAAVILDPSNGEVLAFTSRPAYDPNAFAAGIDRVAGTDMLLRKPLQRSLDLQAREQSDRTRPARRPTATSDPSAARRPRGPGAPA